MEKINIGMYVRTKNGMKIGKIAQIHKAVNHKSWYELKNGLRVYSYEKINEPSYNIIDLIEVGDIISFYEDIDNYKKQYVIGIPDLITLDEIKDKITNDNIRLVSILTKQEMEQMAYKVGE